MVKTTWFLILVAFLVCCLESEMYAIDNVPLVQNVQDEDVPQDLGEQLEVAVMSGTLENVHHILAQGFILELPLLLKSSLLHKAAFNADLRISAFLIEKGLSVNALTESHGYSPLHSAVHAGSVESIKLFVKAGALINRRTAGGQTALHLACAQNKGTIVKLLLELGADTEIPDNNNIKPMHETIWQKSLSALNALIEGKAHLEVLDGFCCTPLFLSARLGFSEGLERLLVSGAQSRVCSFHMNDDSTLSFQQLNDIFSEIVNREDEQCLRILIKRSYYWFMPSEAELRAARVRVFEALFCLYKAGLD